MISAFFAFFAFFPWLGFVSASSQPRSEHSVLREPSSTSVFFFCPAAAPARGQHACWSLELRPPFPPPPTGAGRDRRPTSAAATALGDRSVGTQESGKAQPWLVCSY